MSKYKDMDFLLTEESSVTNYDWLDTSLLEYVKALPEQNWNTLPELAELWNDQDPVSSFQLAVENKQLKRNTPFQDEKPFNSNLTDEMVSDLVVSILKRNLTEGHTAVRSLENLKKMFGEKALKDSEKRLKKVASEEGLLGKVYIDASDYAKCSTKQEASLANNKEALYLLRKSECNGCVFNQEGTCSKYGKKIVSEVPYTQETLEHYVRRAKSLGKDLSGVDKTASLKTQIRQVVNAPDPEVLPDEHKPYQIDPTGNLTVKEAAEIINNTEVVREVIGNLRSRNKFLRIATAMNLGDYSYEVGHALADDPNVEKLRPHDQLLGRLYVDPAYLSDDQMQEVLLDNPEIFQYNLESFSPKEDERFFKDEMVLAKLSNRLCLIQKGHSFTEKDVRKVVSSLRKKSAKSLRGLAQELYRQPLPEAVREYDSISMYKYDPTQGMSLKAAKTLLANHKRAVEIVGENSNWKRIQKESALRLLQGDHGEVISGRIQNNDKLAHLRNHVQLLGRLYTADFMFESEKEKEAFYRRHAHLQNLPKWTNDREFYGSPEICSQILMREALLQGLEPQKDQRKIARIIQKDLPTLMGKSPEFKIKLAKKLYSSPLPKKTASYDQYVIYSNDVSKNMSIKTAMRIFNQYEKVVEKIEKSVSNYEKQAAQLKTTIGKVTSRNLIAKRMILGDHGEGIQSLIQQDPNLQPLSKHVHLLGRLYQADFMFRDDYEKESLLKRNIEVQALPIYHDEAEETFFLDEKVQEKILERAAMVNRIDMSDKEKVASYVSQHRHLLTGKTSNQVRAIAQKIFAKPVITAHYSYEDVPYSTIQDRIANTEVSDQQMKQYQDKIAKKKQERVSTDLAFFFRKKGGKALVQNLVDKFGKDLVKDTWLGKGKTSSSIRNLTQKTAQEQKVLEAVRSPKVACNDKHEPISEIYQTRIGKWLRDALVQGIYGEKLVEHMNNVYTPDDLIQNAHIILHLREEEGLLGNLYLPSDAYSNCAIGARAAKNVKYILHSDSCKECILNNESICQAYKVPVVTEIPYTEQLLRNILNEKVREGILTRKDANLILKQKTSVKSRIKEAMTSMSKKEVVVSDSVYKAHYGEVLSESKLDVLVGEMLAEAREMVLDGKTEKEVLECVETKYGPKVKIKGQIMLDQVLERTRDYMKDRGDLHNIEAPSGYDLLDTFNMGVDDYSILDNIEYDPESEETLLDNITLGGLTLE